MGARPLRVVLLAVLLLAGELALEARAATCPLPGGGAISGRVTVAATGDPLAGASVVAERVIDGLLTTVAETTTGPTGHYQLAALLPADYFVRTRLTELLVDEVWPGAACDQICSPQDAGAAVTVAPLGWVEGVDLALAAGGRLEGLVVSGAAPVPGAVVQGFPVGPVGNQDLAPVIADAGGAWSIDGLQTGSYKVRGVIGGGPSRTARPATRTSSTSSCPARVRAVHGASEVLFDDGFEVVEPGYDCAWSSQVPQPGPPPGPLATAVPALLCGTLEPSNPGLDPHLRSAAAARAP